MLSIRGLLILRIPVLLAAAPALAAGATLEVGPGKRFATPCAAFAAAANGDDILIDAAGSYVRDVCFITRSNLYIRGVNGRPLIDGQGITAGNKGIWTIQGNDVIVDNFEFANALSPDRNGAGIRHEGRNLRVRNSYFHDSQNGILATSHPESETIIELSEFENNGTPDGQAHNVYVNSGARLIFRFNYSHRAIGGHLVKTRAKENFILYNKLTQEDGTGSYECDLPEQGRDWLVGNVLQQGRTSPNQHMISYGSERRDVTPGSFLYLFHNTIVNESVGTDVPVERFLLAPGVQRFPVYFGYNIIYGRGEIHAPGVPVTLGQNLITATEDPLFVDPAAYDYRIREGSPAINASTGEYPGEMGDLARSAFEYRERGCGAPRFSDANPDFGAFEWLAEPREESACNPSRIPEAGLGIVLSSAAPLVGGVSGSGRVILNQAAPANGVGVQLRSSSTELTVPQSVFVPEGAISAAFAFTTRASALQGNVRITASTDLAEAAATVVLAPGGLTGFEFVPATTGGGSTNATGRVTLNSPAPAGGFVVRLSSANPEVVQVPEQLTVAQGQTAGTFTVRTAPVTADTPVVITASSPAGSRTATLTVQPVALLSLVPTATRFGGGSTITLRINFNGPAPAGSSVEFESSNAAVAPAPSSLPVGAGVLFATTAVRSNGVTAPTQVTLTALYRGSRLTVNLMVDPPQLAGVGSTLTTFGSGGAVRMTVSLNAPASAAGSITVSLVSNNPQVLRVPESVGIPPGATSVSFDAQTELVTARMQAIVTASTADGVSRSITLTLDPLVITAMTCPAAARGGLTLTCRPTINGPAPAGGAVVTLATNAETLVGIPANITIPTGQTTVNLLAQTRAVTLPTPVGISATYRGTTRVANVTLTP